MASKKGEVEFDPRDLDRDKTFEANPPHYLWCLHCERAYVRGKFRRVRGLQMCPYEGCGGDTVIDAWDWESVRKDNPSYPEMPIEGDSYSLYGRK
jgi:hypothetical protein